MIAHVLLVAAQPHLSAEQTAELLAALAALAQVPGVERLTFGENASTRSKGYTHAAVMFFADEAALANYATHPHHLDVIRTLDRLAPERLVVDYKTESTGPSE